MDTLGYLEGKVNESISDLNEALGSGSAKSFEDYRFTCGRIESLKRIAHEIKYIKERNEKDD